jgi:pyridoxine/pyridoxamine 5'-phosphate oxidase
MLEINEKHLSFSYFFPQTSFDGLVKSPLALFRSWFDTSARTEYQTPMALMIRSP